MEDSFDSLEFEAEIRLEETQTRTPLKKNSQVSAAEYLRVISEESNDFEQPVGQETAEHDECASTSSPSVELPDEYDELNNDISNVYVSIFRRNKYVANDIEEMVRIFLEASALPDPNVSLHLAFRISVQLFKFLSTREALPESVQMMCEFFGKVSVRAFVKSCNSLFDALGQCAYRLVSKNTGVLKTRALRLVSNVIEAAMSEANEEEEGFDTTIDNNMDLESSCHSLTDFIPEKIWKDWSKLICLLAEDEIASVRNAVLDLLNILPPDLLLDGGRNMKKLVKSVIFETVVSDPSVECQLTACRMLPLISSADIDNCLVLLESGSNFAVRQELARRLIQSVHPKSMNSDQRLLFICILKDDVEEVMRNMLRRELIPQWLSKLSSSVDDVNVHLSSPRYAHPLALIELFNVVEYENIVRTLMIAAMDVYTKEYFSDFSDYADTFMCSFSQDIYYHYRHLTAFSMREGFQSDGVDEWANRLFGHRCIFDFWMERLKNAEYAEKDNALNKLLPSMMEMVLSVREYANKRLTEFDSCNKKVEFIFRQALYLTKFIENEPITINAWRDMLLHIGTSRSMYPSIGLETLVITDLLRTVLPLHVNKEQSLEMIVLATAGIITILVGSQADQPPNEIFGSQMRHFEPSQKYTIERTAVALKLLLKSFPALVKHGELMECYDFVVAHLAFSTSSRRDAYELMGMAKRAQFASYLRHAISNEKPSFAVPAFYSLHMLICEVGLQEIADVAYCEHSDLRDRYASVFQLYSTYLAKCPVDDLYVAGLCAMHLTRLSTFKWDFVSAIMHRQFSESCEVILPKLFDKAFSNHDGSFLYQVLICNAYMKCVNSLITRAEEEVKAFRLADMTNFVINWIYRNPVNVRGALINNPNKTDDIRKFNFAGTLLGSLLKTLLDGDFEKLIYRNIVVQSLCLIPPTYVFPEYASTFLGQIETLQGMESFKIVDRATRMSLRHFAEGLRRLKDRRAGSISSRLRITRSASRLDTPLLTSTPLHSPAKKPRIAKSRGRPRKTASTSSREEDMRESFSSLDISDADANRVVIPSLYGIEEEADEDEDTLRADNGSDDLFFTSKSTVDEDAPNDVQETCSVTSSSSTSTKRRGRPRRGVGSSSSVENMVMEADAEDLTKRSNSKSGLTEEYWKIGH